MFYQKIVQHKASHKKMLGVLIDPDKYTNEMLNTVIDCAQQTKVSFFLIGGSKSIQKYGDYFQADSNGNSSENQCLEGYPCQLGGGFPCERLRERWNQGHERNNG